MFGETFHLFIFAYPMIVYSKLQVWFRYIQQALRLVSSLNYFTESVCFLLAMTNLFEAAYRILIISSNVECTSNGSICSIHLNAASSRFHCKQHCVQSVPDLSTFVVYFLLSPSSWNGGF